MTGTQSGSSLERHGKGTSASILLTSVFGPYACGDEFGSRRLTARHYGNAHFEV
jgi:hypothetical protein